MYVCCASFEELIICKHVSVPDGWHFVTVCNNNTGLLHSFLAPSIRSPAAYGQEICVRLVAKFLPVMSILLGGGCSPA